jgi:hypothetical protein
MNTVVRQTCTALGRNTLPPPPPSHPTMSNRHEREGAMHTPGTPTVTNRQKRYSPNPHRATACHPWILMGSHPHHRYNCLEHRSRSQLRSYQQQRPGPTRPSLCPSHAPAPSPLHQHEHHTTPRGHTQRHQETQLDGGTDSRLPEPETPPSNSQQPLHLHQSMQPTRHRQHQPPPAQLQHLTPTTQPEPHWSQPGPTLPRRPSRNLQPKQSKTTPT